MEGIRDALAFQEDGFDRLESSGLFRVPANPFDADGETLEAEYSRIFHENSRLMDDYLKNIAESTNSLTTSISESATASCEISQNVTGVDVESRQTATGAGSTRTANSKLQSLATDLQEMVADFTV